MARLAIFQPDARSGARLTAALGGVHDLVRCTSWEDLLDAMETAGVEGCLLDADHPSRDLAIPRIELLRDRYRDFALIGFTDRETPIDYYHLGTLGLEAFVAGTAGAMTTRSAVDEALAIRRGRMAGRALEPHVQAPLPEAVGWSTLHATSDVGVEDLARGMDSSLRALREELRARSFPTPAELMLWGRLVAAAARLHLDRRGVEETAFAVGYASGPSLARATRTHIDATPVELAERGPGHVIESFVARVTGAHVRVSLTPSTGPIHE